ncbi:MAG: hypothetical protein ACTHMU_02690, partial [Thermomicrobiales bacterium]
WHIVPRIGRLVGHFSFETNLPAVVYLFIAVAPLDHRIKALDRALSSPYNETQFRELDDCWVGNTAMR